ncbi:MAG: TldD/PmbA family protein [Actinobacteria bacterium]|nr:TldD/PmbA family protein [Actinomycetota bacterium]
MTDLIDIADRVIGWASSDEQVEVFAVHERETEVRAYGQQVESLTVAESQGVGIRVVINGRQGFAHAGTLDLDVLAETLAEARDNVAFATTDEWCAVAEPDGIPPAELDLHRAALTDHPTGAKVAAALELERLVGEADPRIVGVESAEYVDSISESAVVTTTGIRSTSRETGCYLSASVLAGDNGETQTGFGFSIGRQPGDLDPERAAADAVERATRLLGAVKPDSARLTVVLDPWVSAQFLGIVGSTLNGESVLKGRSLFADRLGEEVAAPSLTLIDDPTDVAAFTATAVDGEGLATRRNVLLEDGRLLRFVHNSYTGRRSGGASTGSAVRGYASTPGVGVQALALVQGSRSQAELVADVEDGLLVQGVSGLHSGVNPVSGDFSTGAEGLRIRRGALAEPVREFTIASTIQKMLQDVIEVGGDLEWLPMRAAGVSLVIGDVTVSGA